MLVGVVVLARAMVDLATRVTAFDLDGRVADREPVADSALQVADDVLRVTKWALADAHMAAQRPLFGGQRPDGKVVHVSDERGLADLVGQRLHVDFARGSLAEDVDRLSAHRPCAPRAESCS